MVGQPRLRAAINGVDLFVSELAVPGGGQGGARSAIATEHYGSVLHHGDVVAALDALSSGEPAEPGNTAQVVFLGSADVDEIDAFGNAAVGHGVEAGDVQKADTVFGGAAVGVGFRGGATFLGNVGEAVPICAGLQVVAGQHPAGGAVLEADDLTVQAHALQNPGPDDAARSSGAVHHHGGIWVQVRRNVGDAEGQLATGHAAPAGDAKAAVFLGRSRVEDHHFVAAIHA